MNDLHQKVMIRTPYQDALAQARQQWEHFQCPPRPIGGQSIANTKWKEFYATFSHTMIGMSLKHDLHMIVCQKDIFERWVKIMDLYMQGSLANKFGIIEQKEIHADDEDVESIGKKGKQSQPLLSERLFRCCQGLNNDELRRLQDMILTGVILIKRAKSFPKMMDMEDVAIKMKHDRILKGAIIDYMANLSGVKGLSYGEVSEKYEITKERYENMYRRCLSFVKDTVNMAKKNPQGLPELVLTELRLLHAQHSGKTQATMETLWTILNGGVKLSGFTEIIAACGPQNDIGLVILDTTSTQGCDSEWDTIDFSRLLTCISQISLNDAYSLIVFVPSYGRSNIELQNTLLEVQGSVHVECGGYIRGTHTIRKYSSSQDVSIFLAFISKDEGRKDWSDLIISPEIPSIIFDEVESTEDLEHSSEEVTRKNKKLQQFKMPITFESCNMHGGGLSKFPKHYSCYKSLVESFCPPGKCVLDVYTGGYAMREALQLQRRTIVITRNTKEKTLLEDYVGKMIQDLPNVKSFCDTTIGKEYKEANVKKMPESSIKLMMELQKATHEINVYQMQENVSLSEVDVELIQSINSVEKIGELVPLEQGVNTNTDDEESWSFLNE